MTQFLYHEAPPDRRTPAAHSGLSVLLLGILLVSCAGAPSVGTQEGSTVETADEKVENPSIWESIAEDLGMETGDCSKVDVPAKIVWGPQVQGEMDLSVRIFKGELQAADAEAIVGRLDDFTWNWVRFSKQICKRREAANEGIGTPAFHEISECLKKVLDEQHTVIAALSEQASFEKSDLDKLMVDLKNCYPEGTIEAAPKKLKDNPF